MAFKIRAFVWHLAASLVLASVAILVVFGVWYPFPLYQAVGLTTIFLLVLGIDVVLGPALTFLVAKSDKKSLKFDLGVIVTIQLAAFFYGIYVMAEGRPVWLVLNKDRVDLIQAFEMDNLYLEEANSEYRKLSFSGPKWVSVREPEDAASREIINIETFFAGVDLAVRPDLYLPFSAEAHRIKENSQDIAELYKFNDNAAVERILEKWPEADGFLPMTAFIQFMTVLVRKDSGEVVAIVDLNPHDNKR